MPWTEIVSSASAVIVAVAAVVGLIQLILARKSLAATRDSIEVTRYDIETRVHSEATRLAVDLCIRFAEHVIPLIDEADQVFEKSPLPMSVNQPWDRESYSSKWQAGFFRKRKVKTILKALNAMEAIAIPFVTGAADEAVARESIGMAFTAAAVRYAYVVAAVRDADRPGAFPAVRELADRWA